MKRVLLSLGLMALASAAHAQLFTGGTPFDVSSGGTPGGGGTDPALLTITSPLANAGLTVESTILPGTDRKGAEWLVFKYTTNDGGSIAPNQGNWNIDENGLLLNHAAWLIRGAVQFDVNGVNQALNFSPFGNLSVVSSLTPDLSGISPGPGLEGGVNPDMNPADAFQPGLLGSLGTFLDPFSQLSFTNVTTDSITSYTEALEFAPVNPVNAIPEPSTWLLGLVGFGFLAFFGFKRRVSMIGA